MIVTRKKIDYKERVQKDLKLLLEIGFNHKVAAKLLKLMTYNDFYSDEYQHLRNRRTLLLSYVLRYLDVKK